MTACKVIDFSRWGRDHARPSGELAEYFVDIWAEEVEDETPCLFEYSGRGVMACNNLHLVKGREKTGKSAFGVLLVTAALGGEYLGVRARKGDMRVLWLDTEQDRGTLAKKARKAVEMAQDGEKGARLRVYTLKSLNPAERLKKALEAITESPADFVFLDGVADLCEDFNDQKEAARVVGELTNAAEEAGCALLTVVHTNKTDKSEARGHVGAIAQQKAGEVYEVTRTGNVANVKQALSRFAGVPDIAFEFGDGFALLPAYGGLTKQQQEQQELFATFGKLLAGGKSMNYSQLAEAYAEQEGCSGSTAKNRIAEAKQRGILSAFDKGHKTIYQLTVVADFEGMNDGGKEGKDET